MNDLKTLENIGLSDKEAKVYMACLELGTATVQELAEKSEVKRTSIYNFLSVLIKKGLVSEIKQNDRVFLTAESPNILKDNLKNQEASLNNLLPDLLDLFNKPSNRPAVKYYKGIAGIKKIYLDTLETKQPIYAFTDVDSMIPIMGKWLWDWYPNKRVELGIKFFGIAKDGPLARKAIQRNKQQNREMKIIPDVKFDTEINIYGHKVAMISFQRPYTGVIIEDIFINQTHKSIWQSLWERL